MGTGRRIRQTKSSTDGKGDKSLWWFNPSVKIRGLWLLGSLELTGSKFLINKAQSNEFLFTDYCVSPASCFDTYNKLALSSYCSKSPKAYMNATFNGLF